MHAVQDGLSRELLIDQHAHALDVRIFLKRVLDKAVFLRRTDRALHVDDADLVLTRRDLKGHAVIFLGCFAGERQHLGNQLTG